MGQLTKMFFETSNEPLSEEELLNVRKKYFAKYKMREGDCLTENCELICEHCKGKRYWQDGNFVAGCLCKCQSQALEEQRELEQKKQRLMRFEKLKQASLLGERYKNASFDSLDLNRPQDFIDAVARCKKFCERWEDVKKEGLGIYLYGDVGTGKSLLTACIGNCLLSQMIPVLFTNFFEISKQIKKSFSDSTITESDFVEKLATIDLLIIDDIGTEQMVKNGERTWLQDKIYDVVNARYVNKKPTIFSSNESLVDLVENCGLMKKTVDRIAAMSTAKIKLQGTSYRLTEQQETSIF